MKSSRVVATAIALGVGVAAGMLLVGARLVAAAIPGGGGGFRTPAGPPVRA
jgi:hypothetical protein